MRVDDGKTILITGGAGFIGSNLAARLLERGCRVRIFDSLARPGVSSNLEWLTDAHGDRVEEVVADLRDHDQLARAVRGVDAVYHFAAQVAVTTSLADPRMDFDVNLGATFALLEALRSQRPGMPLIFASTNKVYGDLWDVGLGLQDGGYAPANSELARHGVSEARPLDFHTPYGCSKGAADQYVLDYGRSFGMPTAVLRMSCIYGERQMGTEDQGWVAHFLIRALGGKPVTLFGDGRQVRDICDVGDTCEAYIAALANLGSIAGRAFNWGGGPGNAVSLLGLIEEIGTIIGRSPQVEFDDWRAGDQRWFVADTRSIDQALPLSPRTHWRDGVHKLAQWLCESRGLPLRQEKLGTVGAS